MIARLRRCLSTRFRCLFKPKPPEPVISDWHLDRYATRFQQVLDRHVERCVQLKRAGLYDHKRQARELMAEIDLLDRELMD